MVGVLLGHVEFVTFVWFGFTMLGRRIARARRKAKLNQSQLARLIGVTRASVNGWEKRGGNPRLDNLRKIARITRTPLSELVGGASS